MKKNNLPKVAFDIAVEDIFNYPRVSSYADSWAPELWKAKMEQAKENHDSSAMMRLRREVFKSTVYLVNKGSYSRARKLGPTVYLMKNRNIGSQSRFYRHERNHIGYKINTYDTKVEVQNIDCLVCARNFKEEHPKEDVCVLNMASGYMPGGGVIQGYGAQEEYLFRCSDYFRSLYRYRSDVAKAFGLIKSKGHSYPISQYGNIFTRDVTVFRGPEEDGYYLLLHPFKINIIAAVAVNINAFTHLEVAYEFIHKIMLEKIRNIFRTAYINGQENLILGAFGCGVFKNDPNEVALLFKQVIDEDEFKGLFKNIVFAIKDDATSPKGGNYAPFANILNK